MPRAYIREDEARIVVQVIPFSSASQTWDKSGAVTIGNLVTNYWATFEGGDLASQDSKTRAGGMNKQRSVGGPNERSDATLTIQFDAGIAAFHTWLESCVGSAMVTISVTYLDPNANSLQMTPYGGNSKTASFSNSGTLKGVSRPKQDANGNAVGFYTLTASLDE